MAVRDALFLGLNILLVISTFGVGAMLPIATVSVQNAVDLGDLGTATAAMQFFDNWGLQHWWRFSAHWP